MKLLYLFFCFLFSIQLFSQENKFDLPSSDLKKLLDSANYFLNSNTKKAEELYNQALAIANKDSDSINLAKIFSQLGNLNEIKGAYSTSIDYHLKSLDINTKLRDSFLISVNYHNIGMVMRFQNDLEASKEYFEKAIDIKKNINDAFNLGISYNMLGVVYRLEGDYGSAEAYYLKAFNIFKALNNREQLMQVYGNLAVLYDFRKEYDKAIGINLMAIPFYKQINNKSALARRYTNIALSLDKLNRYNEAIKFLDSSITICEDQGYLESLSNNYRFRSNINYKLKKFKIAFDDYSQYKILNDSVFNINKTKEITTKLLQVEFEKQKALDSLRFVETQKNLEYINKTEKNKKNIYFILLIVSGLMGVVTLSNFRIKRNLSKATLEKEQLESELLKQKLDATEREAQRVIQGKSISLTHKKNLLSQIKSLIKKHDSKSIFRDLNMLTMELDQQTKSETLDYILDEKMEELHVEFEKKLINQYPDLTKTEREICSLIRANMSIKDISNIKGVTSASVQSARYRIRKKMGLNKGEELQQFIQNLF